MRVEEDPMDEDMSPRFLDALVTRPRVRFGEQLDGGMDVLAGLVLGTLRGSRCWRVFSSRYYRYAIA